MYSNIKEIKKETDVNEVNNLLKGGWKLLEVHVNKGFIFILYRE